MTTVAVTAIDAATMLRRNLLRAVRYPIIFYMVGIPVVFLLLFVYVLGGTLGAGIAPGGGTGAYLQYVVPGVLMLTIASGPQMTAISVAQDMTEGIIARFRTMAIARSAVLAGHVLGSTIQLVVAVVVVAGVAALMGFRPSTAPLAWLGALALMTAIAFAFSWLAAALGLQARSVESASNLPMPLSLLPFLGSGFVLTASMPDAVRWFAEVQPFTPFIETLRGLLLGTPIGSAGWVSLAWCLAIGVGGFAWAMALYERRSLRTA
jgi:ABC-2 type transport system permease protein